MDVRIERGVYIFMPGPYTEKFGIPARAVQKAQGRMPEHMRGNVDPGLFSQLTEQVVYIRIIHCLSRVFSKKQRISADNTWIKSTNNKISGCD